MKLQHVKSWSVCELLSRYESQGKKENETLEEGASFFSPDLLF